MNTYKVIGNDGQEYGPVDLATVRAWVAEGRIASDTQVQAVGTTEWKPASDFPELGVASTVGRPLLPPQASRSPSALQPAPAAKPGNSRFPTRSRSPWVFYMLVAVTIVLVVLAGVMILAPSLRGRATADRARIAGEQAPAAVNAGGGTQASGLTTLAPSQAQSFKRPQEDSLRAKEEARGDSNLDLQRYRKAAEQGEPEAQYQLGNLYARGLGVARNYTEAAKWYRLAADQGYAPAQHWLGHLYARGQGLETAHAEAPEPLATEPGKTVPGQQGLWSDAAEAAKWWRKAAEQGDAGAQFDLGWLYAHGRGVETNYAQAVAWYRRSAEQGNSAAQHWLGHCFLNGTGVVEDEAEAFRWFRDAAEAGIPAAQNDLGRMYAKGRGVEQDSTQALGWYRKAADAGLPSAQNNLAWALATSTNANLRNGSLAVDFAEKAVSATRRADASFLDTLAAAHAETGDFAEAVAIQKEALALLREPGAKQDYTSRLRLYQANTPYREETKQ